MKNVQLSLFRKNVSGNMSINNQYLACPSDFLAPFSLSFTDADSNKIFLDFKDTDFVQSFNPNSATTGNPRYYASFDVDNFIIGPTPNASRVVELHYFYRPLSITDSTFTDFYRPASLTAGSDSGTTWLSENAQVALLYGTLVEAYIYMKGEPDIMAQYEKRFAESVNSMKMLGEYKEVTDQYRQGLVIREKS